MKLLRIVDSKSGYIKRCDSLKHFDDYTSTDWNYEGETVILIANPSYEFVGTTNIKLDGEIYGFGRYYLGDVLVERLEELSSYNGNNRVSTMYRYNLDVEGEEYLFYRAGVSIREEAISLMKENFEQLSMGNFIYY